MTDKKKKTICMDYKSPDSDSDYVVYSESDSNNGNDIVITSKQ